MSDAREPEAARPQRPGAAGIVVIVVVVLLLLGVLAMVLADREDGQDEVAPSPSPGDPTPTAPFETPATPGPGLDELDDTDREPTDDDAAEFSSAYSPPGGSDVQTITADVSGDGRNEVLVASIAAELVRLDVAVWTGRAYEVVFTDQGGRADEIVEFAVLPLTDDTPGEIVTIQQAGDQGESLSLWAWTGESVARQAAQGGCWDGSHTYGIVGAEIIDEGETEIHATCDDSPLPQPAWTTDIYTWDGQAWQHARTEPE